MRVLTFLSLLTLAASLAPVDAQFITQTNGGASCNARKAGCNTSGGLDAVMVPAEGLMWTMS